MNRKKTSFVNFGCRRGNDGSCSGDGGDGGGLAKERLVRCSNVLLLCPHSAQCRAGAIGVETVT